MSDIGMQFACNIFVFSIQLAGLIEGKFFLLFNLLEDIVVALAVFLL